MSMRVTQYGSDQAMIQTLDSSLARLATLQQQVSTGRAINLPSDNPGGTATALDLNAQIGRYQQYGANASDGTAWLNTADTTLGTVSTALQQVQTAVLAGANTSAADSSTRSALAQQVAAIKQTLLVAASTSYQGRPVFSGTWGSDPYAGAASGNYAYTGSPQPQTRTIGPGQQAQIGVVGSDVFGSGSTSVFALLDQISTDLTSGNASALSGSDLSQLQAAMGQATDARAKVGALSNQLAQVATAATDKVTALQGSVSGVVDVNEAQAATELQLQEVSYQAALATTAKIIQPSLVSFLG